MAEHDELAALWRAQPTKVITMAIGELKKRESKLERVVGVRNALEYGAGALVAATFSAMMFGPIGWVARIGCVLIVFATIRVIATVRRRGSAEASPSMSAPTREHLAHLRAQLERQRDLLASVPRWYLAPFLPGYVVFLGGVAIDLLSKGVPVSKLLLPFGNAIALAMIVFGAVVVANRKAAAKLAREIAGLED
jgi:hypothetical protein